MQTTTTTSRFKRVLLLFAFGAIAFCGSWIVSSLVFEVYRPIRIYPEEVLPRGEAV